MPTICFKHIFQGNFLYLTHLLVIFCSQFYFFELLRDDIYIKFQDSIAFQPKNHLLRTSKKLLNLLYAPKNEILKNDLLKQCFDDSVTI